MGPKTFFLHTRPRGSRGASQPLILRETMESDHRSSARHKLCAPPALSLPGSPSFPAVCAVWDWGRSIHQAEGGLLDPCISVLGSPRPLGRVSRCWVPPKWGRSITGGLRALFSSGSTEHQPCGMFFARKPPGHRLWQGVSCGASWSFQGALVFRNGARCVLDCVEAELQRVRPSGTPERMANGSLQAPV